jgi:hypothetical protein
MSCCVHVQQLGGILSTFAARVDDLASRIPAAPPLAAITGDISARIASSAEQLAAAAIPALRTTDPMFPDTSGNAISPSPDAIFADLLGNANTALELVLRDIRNQKGMVPNLLEGLKAGPLGPLVEGAENTLKQVSAGIDVSTPQEDSDRVLAAHWYPFIPCAHKPCPSGTHCSNHPVSCKETVFRVAYSVSTSANMPDHTHCVYWCGCA